MPAKRNIIGLIFGRGKVIREAPRRFQPNGRPVRYSLLVCQCGTQYVAANSNLIQRAILSCGCLQRENGFRNHTTHGHTRGRKTSRIYWVWAAMIQRCTNPNDKRFKDYGGRGIRVCKKWRQFENFLHDMGEGKRGWCLERINNNEGYFITNCCWATNTYQARNTRRNVRYTVHGVTGCISELCEHFGLKDSRVRCRIRKLKWSIERAFS